MKQKETVYYLTPKGKIFNQDIAKDIVKKNKVNILCGHFEGVDQRVLDSRNIEEISIGDFILSGGEMASFVVLDTFCSDALSMPKALDDVKSGRRACTGRFLSAEFESPREFSDARLVLRRFWTPG